MIGTILTRVNPINSNSNLMKKVITLFACAAVLALSNCGNKKEEKTEETTISADKAASSTPTLEERRARIKREREEYAERRRLAAEERAKASQSYTDAKGKTVYYVVDEDPSYGGSQEQLEQYIQDNISYPESAKIDQVEGTVFVEFVIGSDGVVRDVEASEGTSDAVKQNLSEEAVRVVSSMPKWTPGKKGGKAVDTKVSLPITFQLEP